MNFTTNNIKQVSKEIKAIYPLAKISKVDGGYKLNLSNVMELNKKLELIRTFKIYFAELREKEITKFLA